MEAAGALASLAPSPITVLGLIPLLALGITYFRYQQFDPESYITDANTVSTLYSNFQPHCLADFTHDNKFLVLTNIIIYNVVLSMLYCS